MNVKQFMQAISRGWGQSKKLSGRGYIRDKTLFTHRPSSKAIGGIIERPVESAISFPYKLGWKTRRVVEPYIGTKLEAGYKIGRSGYKYKGRGTEQIKSPKIAANPEDATEIIDRSYYNWEREHAGDIQNMRSFAHPSIRIGYAVGSHPYRVVTGASAAMIGTAALTGRGGILERPHPRKSNEMPLLQQWEEWERKYNDKRLRYKERPKEPEYNSNLRGLQPSGGDAKVSKYDTTKHEPSLSAGPRPGSLGRRTTGYRMSADKTEYQDINKPSKEDQEGKIIRARKLLFATKVAYDVGLEKLQKCIGNMSKADRSSVIASLDAMKENKFMRQALADMAEAGSVPAILILGVLAARLYNKYMQTMYPRSTTRGYTNTPYMKYPNRYINRMLSSPGPSTLGNIESVLPSTPLYLGSKTGDIRKSVKMYYLSPGESVPWKSWQKLRPSTRAHHISLRYRARYKKNKLARKGTLRERMKDLKIGHRYLLLSNKYLDRELDPIKREFRIRGKYGMMQSSKTGDIRKAVKITDKLTVPWKTWHNFPKSSKHRHIGLRHMDRAEKHINEHEKRAKHFWRGMKYLEASNKHLEREVEPLRIEYRLRGPYGMYQSSKTGDIRKGISYAWGVKRMAPRNVAQIAVRTARKAKRNYLKVASKVPPKITDCIQRLLRSSNNKDINKSLKQFYTTNIRGSKEYIIPNLSWKRWHRLTPRSKLFHLEQRELKRYQAYLKSKTDMPLYRRNMGDPDKAKRIKNFITGVYGNKYPGRIQRIIRLVDENDRVSQIRLHNSMRHWEALQRANYQHNMARRLYGKEGMYQSSKTGDIRKAVGGTLRVYIRNMNRAVYDAQRTGQNPYIREALHWHNKAWGEINRLKSEHRIPRAIHNSKIIRSFGKIQKGEATEELKGYGKQVRHFMPAFGRSVQGKTTMRRYPKFENEKMTDRVGHKDIPYTKRRYYSHPGQKIYPNEKKYKGAMNVGRKVGWGSHAFNTGFSDGKKRLVHSNTLYRAGKATRKTPGLNQVYRVGRWASRDPVTAGFVGALGYGAYKAFKNRKRVQYE